MPQRDPIRKCSVSKGLQIQLTSARLKEKEDFTLIPVRMQKKKKNKGEKNPSENYNKCTDVITRGNMYTAQ